MPPAPVGTVGGSRRVPGGRHVTRKKWEELLDEIRLEKEALEAPTRAKKALEAVANAKRAAAELAEQLELNQAEALARDIVAIERMAKSVDAIRIANELARDIQARIDEDEDDIMLMVWAI